MRIEVAIHAAGLGLIYEGPCTGGEIGAGFVRWPDVRRGVLSGGNLSAAQQRARAGGGPAALEDVDLPGRHARIARRSPPR